MAGIWMHCLQCGEPVRTHNIKRKYCSDRCRVARGRGKEQTWPEPDEMAALEKDILDNEKYWEKSQQEHIRLIKRIVVENKLRKYAKII